MLANLLMIIDIVDIVDNRDCSVCKAIAAFLPADDPCVVGDDQHTPRCVWAVVLVLGSWYSWKRWSAKYLPTVLSRCEIG